MHPWNYDSIISFQVDPHQIMLFCGWIPYWAEGQVCDIKHVSKIDSKTGATTNEAEAD